MFSDEQGRYNFPASKLGPGRYSLKIRAVGYDLEGPKAVDMASGKVTTGDIKLRPTKNLAAQLSDAEWLLSIPGTEEQKKFLLNCNSCHTIERIMKSTHNADEWVQVFQRMSLYAPGSTPLRPQMTVGGVQRDRARGADVKAVAEWLATVNLHSSSTWEYLLKTLPRPKGRATRAIITEYDLPRKLAEPHDVVVDSDGMAWYSDFGEQFIGKVDPKTGKVTEYPIPVLKKGFPTGTLDLQLDKDENLWVSLMYQGGIAKFDRKTEKFDVYPVPKEWQGNHTQQSMVSPTNSHVDGKVWSIGEKLLFQDMQGNELARIQQRLLSWGPTYEIHYPGGTAVMRVTFKRPGNYLVQVFGGVGNGQTDGSGVLKVLK